MNFLIQNLCFISTRPGSHVNRQQVRSSDNLRIIHDTPLHNLEIGVLVHGESMKENRTYIFNKQYIGTKLQTPFLNKFTKEERDYKYFM